MEVFHGIAEAKGLAGGALVLGNFDGVHVGHQALFRVAAGFGRVAAFTFQPHPGKVLQPELAPKLVTTLERKLELLAEAEVAAVVLQPFTREYARTSPEAFEASVLDALAVRHVVVGMDFTYRR